MTKFILEAKDIFYQYGDGTKALNDVNMAVEINSKAAILGPNGAGKSTLLLHLNGLLKPTSGGMYYNGKQYIYQKSFLNNLKRTVGVLFQNPDNQLFSASVIQDISFGLMNIGVSKEIALKKIHQIGEQLGISNLYNKPTHFLSVGQKKMVALAGVLVMEPEVIVCDEPTAGLDPYNAKIMVDVLNQLQINGTTVLISTHDVDLAYSWADTVFILDSGQIVEEGNPSRVFSNDSILISSHLETPLILEIWLQLKGCGLVKPDSEPPKNKEDLFEAFVGIKNNIN
ncbi:MAG: hypothetical protein APF76_00635 [Desulfitibacter sp. BRH_c19]|nr:MAG: hypothetical protein APF76_00635 [Desulfitibacter sp. BRH_c19]